MEALVGGAALGSLFSELFNLVIDRVKQTNNFRTELDSLEKTLKRIEPRITNITELNGRPVEESRTTLNHLLEEGKKLVVKCTKIHPINLTKKHKYSAKLTDLNNNLLQTFNIEALGGIATGINAIKDRESPFRPCNVPGVSAFTVGLDQHVKELKRMLLEKDTQLLVVSGPGGGGKTTLAKKFCHDDSIKDKFGENIIYVTVSKETSLKNIAQDLFKHYDIKNYVLKSEEDAKNQIENLLRQKGPGNMLLVLDDVWSSSVIWDLKFQIPGYKMLITSRDLFQEFNSTYNLSLLNAKDAEALFCHHAFPSGQIPANNVLKNLAKEMVEVCKGLPLALTVVGASLCNQPEVKWRSTLQKWSEGQSILKSHKNLLDCLKTSIDALDEENHENVKDCFLDFGLFPEDDQIPGTALLDMWIELYNLGDDTASSNLLHIASRNLINLVSIRNVIGEMDGHCSQYHVMQHDVLRELAIHLNRQEPEAKRRRLSMETDGDNLPKWWTKQPLDARVLSILIDGEFSSTWDDLDAPNVEVLILNIRSENCSLQRFIEKMSQLKVLIVTGFGGYPTQLDNLEFLASLSKLSRIRFEHVSVSSSIQVIFTLKTLTKLTFVMCKIGDAFNIGANLENLKDVEFDLCYDLKQLPAGLCSSVHLRKLIVTNCQELDSLPKELGNLTNLEILGLHCCTKLKELPESIESLCKLSSLDISDCSHISALPKQIGELRSLRLIDISGCNGLKELPKSLAELKQLETVICDEERSHLWKVIGKDGGNVKIKLVQEDSIETLKKIFSSFI